jgi:site-specific DNA recombinase
MKENRMRHRCSCAGARWLLQGLLVCPKCGYALYGLRNRRRRTDGSMVEHTYYRCSGRNGRRFGGQPVCDNRQLPVRDLDEAVWRDVCDLLRNPAKVRGEYERRQNDGPTRSTSLQAEQLHKQILNLKRAITRLIDAYQEGLLEKSEFAPRLQTAHERLQRLEKQVQEEAEEQVQQEELRLALRALEQFAHQVQEGLDQADWHQRREIIRALVKRIEVGHQEVRIVYRVSPPPFAKGPKGARIEHCWRLLGSTCL